MRDRSQRSEDGRRPGEMRYDVFYEKFHWVKKTKEEGRWTKIGHKKGRRLVKKMKLNCGAERHHYSTFDVQCSMLDVHFLAAESELPLSKRSSNLLPPKANYLSTLLLSTLGISIHVH